MIKYVRLILGLIALLSPDSFIFNKWLSKPSINEILVTGQAILDVGPFLDDDEFTKCTKSIRSADWNFDKKVDRVEFNIAVAIWTNDAIPALQSQSSLPLTAAFNAHSCVELRFCDSSTAVCCEEGFEKYISIDFDQSLLEQNLFQVCAATESAIITITDSFPSAAPSGSVVLPTVKPSLKPSSAPTEDITLNPSTKLTSFPTLTPTSDPTLLPTEKGSSKPSFVPSSSPTNMLSPSPSAAPSTPKPTSLGSPKPSYSAIPSSIPTNMPSDDPTIFPSLNPSATLSSLPSSAPSSIPSNPPSSFPSTGPTNFGSGSPSTKPSSVPTKLSSVAPSTTPTSVPINNPSGVPSIMPSSVPSNYPSSNPSARPTEFPTPKKSSVPSLKPSPTPSLTPSVSFYGVNADEILSGDGNTIANDLISAVTTIVLSLIDEQSQGNKRLIKTIQNNGISDQSNSHVLIVHKNEVLERLKAPRRNGLISIQSYRDDKNEGSRRAVRKLVKYRPDTPVFHRSILQDICDPPGITDECIIVRTVVTVYLDENEDGDEIRSLIVNGFNQAINDGTFFDVLSQI